MSNYINYFQPSDHADALTRSLPGLSVLLVCGILCLPVIYYSLFEYPAMLRSLIARLSPASALKYLRIYAGMHGSHCSRAGTDEGCVSTVLMSARKLNKWISALLTLGGVTMILFLIFFLFKGVYWGVNASADEKQGHWIKFVSIIWIGIYVVACFCGLIRQSYINKAVSMLDEQGQSSTDYCKTVELMFASRYGMQAYAVALWLFLAPVILASISIWALMGERMFWNSSSKLPVNLVAASAITGALIWVAYDHLRRMSRQEFSPVDLNHACVRILLAVPLGLSVQALLTTSIGCFIAFAMGAFPLREIRLFIRKSASGAGGSFAGLATSETLGPNDKPIINELEKLQGINRAHALKLEEAGIETIGQLARADVLDLSFRTSFEFNFLLDCVNEAIVWTYIGEALPDQNLALLRKHGIKGIVAMKRFTDDMAWTGSKQTAEPFATELLASLASESKLSSSAIRGAFLSIGRDRYAEFITMLSEQGTVPETAESPDLLLPVPAPATT
jgi:hypothetical protein